MSETAKYRSSLLLPKTNFPMRSALHDCEAELLARWKKQGIYERCRMMAAGKPRFIVHDGPPYANGNIHMGHALNKILKDVVVRSHGMLGYDSNYVPGWDCHGLPIEWKIEEQYRANGKTKDAVSIQAFRHECRLFADHWVEAQRTQFMRLGILADWEQPYKTMSFTAEAQIARELMKFAENGALYRGSKPVMWSVVERTSLAEAEIEYQDHISDTIWVKFPIDASSSPAASEENLSGAFVVIWTTTPWTIPANRAISFSSKITYALFEVTEAAPGAWIAKGDRFVVADPLAQDTFHQTRVTAYRRLATIPADVLSAIACTHPLRGFSPEYGHMVPLLAADFVTADTGTGFVHCSPGHGRDDFDVWTANSAALARRGIDTVIPYMVDAAASFTAQAGGFTGRRIITDTGETGDANGAVIEALREAGMLVGSKRLKHQYPHSWRSKKPVIYRNTPQWFIAMDRPIEAAGSANASDTLRNRALAAIKVTRWVPVQGQNRIVGMIESRPDWVISRQRSWGVPISIFVRESGGSLDILKDARVNARILDAFESEGADAWYDAGAAERFLLPDYDPAQWTKIDDILDVWFESGSTHAFTLEVRDDLKNRRKHHGGNDVVMYLEGSDQHRGWFHSSLLESCGTRNAAPFDVVLTHGFVLDAEGRKMSKSTGNVVAPEDVLRQSGADVLRMWVCSSDYADDLRIGPEIMKNTAESYRKLRNTLRWLLGSLAHFRSQDRVTLTEMPDLERLMLHKVVELGQVVRRGYLNFDYKRVLAAISVFMTNDLSAFYFDVRKDSLYCDPISSTTRKACLTTLDYLFRYMVTWLSPILCFTAEEAWLARMGDVARSVHLESFPEIPTDWRNDLLAAKWEKVRSVRRVVTAALEIARAEKTIGSSLEAAPTIYVSDPDLMEAIADVDMAELSITSDVSIIASDAPALTFRLPEIDGVAVEVHLAHGRRCARSWKIRQDVGSDPDYPDVSARDAKALREWAASQDTRELLTIPGG
jgi:isoleucyl-tRNA synthetase